MRLTLSCRSCRSNCWLGKRLQYALLLWRWWRSLCVLLVSLSYWWWWFVLCCVLCLPPLCACVSVFCACMFFFCVFLRVLVLYQIYQLFYESMPSFVNRFSRFINRCSRFINRCSLSGLLLLALIVDVLISNPILFLLPLLLWGPVLRSFSRGEPRRWDSTITERLGLCVYADNKVYACCCCLCLTLALVCVR